MTPDPLPPTKWLATAPETTAWVHKQLETGQRLDRDEGRHIFAPPLQGGTDTNSRATHGVLPANFG
eukprot:3870377-Amphidinium_carterae.2